MGSTIEMYTRQAGIAIDFDEDSYAVFPIVESINSCITPVANTRKLTKLLVQCKQVTTETITLHDNSSIVLSTSLNLRVRDLDHTLARSEEECNDGNIDISSTSAGSNTIANQCFNYGSAGSITFDPPVVTNPTTCNDAWWLYRASLDPSSVDSPLPSNLQIAFDSSNNQVSWSLVDAT